MNTEELKGGIVTSVYHIDKERKIKMHKHDKNDELFYCVSGSGFGVLEDSELFLTVGTVFTVPAGTMHSLRTDEDLYVCSFLIPLVEE